MNLLPKLALFMVAISAMQNVAFAAGAVGPGVPVSDFMIDFDGQLVSQTCTITVNNVVSPAEVTVTLPTVLTSLLDLSGKTAGRTDFEIKLNNCSGGAATAAAFFEAGTDVEPVSGQLINHGTATNVRLQLLDNSTPISVGSTEQLADTSRIAINSGNAVLPYAVQYYATGVATAGTVLSTVTYSIDYH